MQRTKRPAQTVSRPTQSHTAPPRTPTSTSPTARERFIDAVARAGGSRAVAARLGCTRSYVDLIRAAQRRPGMRVAFRIEEEFGIAMQDWVEPRVPATRFALGEVARPH